MTTDELRHQIQCAAKQVPSDLVIKNCNVVNVFNHEIDMLTDIAIADGKIVGIGKYDGKKEIDGTDLFAIPGLIESHIHIESSFLTPEEFGRMTVPFGTTTVVADPHEIANVCGKDGLKYMMDAADKTALDIKYMLPSCVPATPFENAGATLSAKDMAEFINDPKILGLGELMNYVGVVNCDEEVLEKVLLAKNAGKIIDGHAPGIYGETRQAYTCAGVKTDHECSNIAEMNQSIHNGMYVEMRDGSACHDVDNLIPGITKQNSRRILLCSDDRQPVTFYRYGDLNNHLRICVNKGVDAFTAIQMGTLNAAECYKLTDRGALAPGYKADIVLMDNLIDFNARKVFINGELVAEDGKYLKEVERADITKVTGTVHLKDFSAEKLAITLKPKQEGLATVHTIEIAPGSIVTKHSISEVKINNKNQFVFDENRDIVKIAVIERHKMTGNVGLGLLKNYGMKEGAIAITIAHDSHNIICAGTSDEEMAFAVEKLVEQNGGIIVVKNQQVLERMELPVAGLMSDKDGKWVEDKMAHIHKVAYDELGINKEVSPISTLCFMALPVIPELKITDKGLFDVTKFQFIDINGD